MRSWKIWPSPPADVRAFRLELVVCDVVGLPLGGVEDGGRSSAMVQVRWSGTGRRRSSVARRSPVDRNFTGYSPVGPDGAVSWGEEFRHECKMRRPVDPQKGFKSWIVKLEIHGFGAITKNSSSLLAKTQLDVSEFASDLGKEGSAGIPFICSIRGFRGEAQLRQACRTAMKQDCPAGSCRFPGASACLAGAKMAEKIRRRSSRGKKYRTVLPTRSGVRIPSGGSCPGAWESLDSNPANTPPDGDTTAPTLFLPLPHHRRRRKRMGVGDSKQRGDSRSGDGRKGCWRAETAAWSSSPTCSSPPSTSAARRRRERAPALSSPPS